MTGAPYAAVRGRSTGRLARDSRRHFAQILRERVDVSAPSSAHRRLSSTGLVRAANDHAVAAHTGPAVTALAGTAALVSAFRSVDAITGDRTREALVAVRLAALEGRARRLSRLTAAHVAVLPPRLTVGVETRLHDAGPGPRVLSGQDRWCICGEIAAVAGARDHAEQDDDPPHTAMMSRDRTRCRGFSRSRARRTDRRTSVGPARTRTADRKRRRDRRTRTSSRCTARRARTSSHRSAVPSRSGRACTSHSRRRWCSRRTRSCTAPDRHGSDSCCTRPSTSRCRRRCGPRTGTTARTCSRRPPPRRLCSTVPR
jgi:hypothetical protein